MLVNEKERNKEEIPLVVSWKQQTRTHIQLICVWSVRNFSWNSPPNNIAIKLCTNLVRPGLAYVHLNSILLQLIGSHTKKQQKQILKLCTSNYAIVHDTHSKHANHFKLIESALTEMLLALLHQYWLLVCIGKHDDDDSDNECTDFSHTKETHSHWHTTLSSDIQCVDLCEILDWFFVDNHSRRFVLLSYVSVALFVLCICSTCFGVCAPIQICSYSNSFTASVPTT